MDGVSTASSAVNVNSPPPFLSKTYDMVDDPATDLVVSWSSGNNSFVVWNVPEFSRDLLPKYFKHNNFSSFVRQLNTYGFRKVDPDRWEFANEGFLRGQKHLLKSINRRKPAHVHSQQQPQVQSTVVGACVEVGKFGLEEEVERLKRDKNVLMQELVRLRQQQQGTDHQLQTVGQRVQVMEQRQQQMMSFLAKAMQSPGFLTQLVQQHNEGNRLIAGSNKKRRFPKQDEEDSGGQYVSPAPNGRIVKYQPLMNEAAKAMLRQILKINASPQLDQSIKNPDAFLIDDVPSPCSALDSGSSSSQISGVTLSEVTPTTAQSSIRTDSGVPVSLISAPIPDFQSSPCVVTEPPKSAQIPETEINLLNCREDAIVPNFTRTREIMPKGSVELPDVNFAGSDIAKGCNMDPMSFSMNGTLPVETDEFSSDPDMGILLDEAPKLPGIDDVFWEQFLTASPLTGDTDEIDSTELEGVVFQGEEFKPGLENGWNKTQRMDHLTEQMGLLASETKKG